MSSRFLNSFVIISYVLCCVSNVCETRSFNQKKTTKLLDIIEEDVQVTGNQCENLPQNVLTDVLGSAYNSRYMSIEEPGFIEEDVLDDSLTYKVNKRKSSEYRPFYVDDNFALEISDKPAWEVKHVPLVPDGSALKDRTKRQTDYNDGNVINRGKRSAKRRTSKQRNNDRPWECEAKIKWIDLGPDYFPRFLRTVECTKHVCWYGHYSCKPRSFTVKILRRRTGECVPSNGIRAIGTTGLPGELRELWVWEERAVNFCCDCSA